jgi:dolichol-phosphate mannosyltransferase
MGRGADPTLSNLTERIETSPSNDLEDRRLSKPEHSRRATPESPPLRLIIPVYNEGANFPSLWEAIKSSIQSEFEAIVVYDFEEDDTVPLVRGIMEAGERRLRLLRNTVGVGVVGALRTAFQYVRKGPVLVVMADLSDDLTQVDQMLELYRKGHHLVAASRYTRGGRVLGGPWLKKNLSRLAGLTLHWFRGLPTSDATNAFKLYDATLLNEIEIESRGGFEINLEVTVKAFLGGYSIVEIPTTWRDRARGKSRFRLWTWLPRYLKWYGFAFRPRRDFRQAS